MNIPVAKPSISPTVGLNRFLEDRGFVSLVSAGEENLLSMIDQLQRDIVNDDNFERMSGAILGMKKVQEAIQLCASKGRALQALQR